MTQAIAVLALDAADTVLVDRFGCNNMMLDNHGSIESFADERHIPMTWEVWPAVATGRHSSEMAAVEMQWDNPLMRFAQKFTRHLPMHWRETLGKPFRSDHVSGFKQVDEDDMFIATPNWPGVTEARDLRESWAITESSAKGELNRGETLDKLAEQFGAQLGWLATAAERSGGIVGVHSHILDAAGHLFGDDEAEYAKYYQKANAMIGRQLSDVDKLLILSDHGMQTTANNDSNPGVHSWRAFIATNFSDSLPQDMFSVRPWLEARSAPYNAGQGAARDEEVLQQLEDLGYIE